jgi:hypothetical protein
MKDSQAKLKAIVEKMVGRGHARKASMADRIFYI